VMFSHNLFRFRMDNTAMLWSLMSKVFIIRSTQYIIPLYTVYVTFYWKYLPLAICEPGHHTYVSTFFSTFQGRVWIHPRSPNPEESSLGPSLLPLQIYESWANKEIMKSILNQPSGHVKLNKVCSCIIKYLFKYGTWTDPFLLVLSFNKFLSQIVKSKLE
jgi:hypothetical protein